MVMGYLLTSNRLLLKGQQNQRRMQHFGQNKELGVPPVNIFGSCHENRNVAYSKFLGVNDKNVHGSIERISINV